MPKLRAALGLALVLVAPALVSTAAFADAPAATCPQRDVTVAWGEIVTPREHDSREGWLALTYVEEALAALQNGEPAAAQARTARAQRLLGPDGQCIRQTADQSASAHQAVTSLARAEAALAAGDRTAATRALIDAATNLHHWVVALDAALFPGYRGSR